MVVLFNAGDQLPVIPFKEVVGKVLNTSPEQIAGTALNVGVVFPGDVMAALAVLVHPLASFTVMVYGAAARPVKILLTWNTVPSLLYCSSNVPPVAVAVMVPSLKPQDASEDDKVIVGPGRFSTVTAIDLEQRFISLTNKVQGAAGTLLKILLAW